MAVTYPNFYENLKEAQMRLRSTTVMYDGEPYFVLAICNHKPDGVFRAYLVPLGRDPLTSGSYPDMNAYNYEQPELGVYLDSWLDKNPKSGILRKNMDSKHFNKFRPFPLGMCNSGTKTYYLERSPQRNREQGLTRAMVNETPVTTANRGQNMRYPGMTVDMSSEDFKHCIMSKHPSASECLLALLDPTIENEAAAFHRHFALVRGPIEMIFLAYKNDIVGVLPRNSLDIVKIGREFLHTKEAVTELNVFATVA